MHISHKANILGIVAGLLFTLFFISLGVITAIQCRSIYYHDISSLRIAETTGYSEAMIRENYDALMDYCSPFYQGELVFPSLPSSEEGLQHFEEVKSIFVSFYYILVISFLILLPLICFALKKGQYKIFKISGFTSIILPCLVGLACMIDFNSMFLLFHKLFFRNNYWLFNPYTDPVINILPEAFFLHCAIVIVGIVLLGTLLQFLSYWFFAKKVTHQ